MLVLIFFFFSSRRRHTRFSRDWSSDVCSSDLRGRDVSQGGWLSVEVKPDAVGQQRKAGDLRGPGVASAAGLWALIADDQCGRADRDEHVAVLTPVGDDEGPASGECHLGAVGVTGVQV